MSYVRNDLTGKRFGKLMVINRDLSKNRKVIYSCLCDCGNTCKVVYGSLNQGLTKSCGCLRAKQSADISAFNVFYRTYRRNAKKRGLSFELDKDFIKELSQQSCKYCGALPNNKAIYNKNGGAIYVYNGIDRIDSSLGYTKDNVVACCAICNIMKSDLSYNDFLIQLIRINNHLASDITLLIESVENISLELARHTKLGNTGISRNVR